MNCWLGCLRQHLLFLPAILLLLVAGCRPASSVSSAEDSAATTLTSRSANVATPGVGRLPRYREAIRRYQRHDYAGALGQIDLLLAQAEQSGTQADILFLERQRALCQGALTGSSDSKSAVISTFAAVVAPPRAAGAATRADCGPRALLVACNELNVSASLPGLIQAAGTTKTGTTLVGLAKAAGSVGLQAAGVQMDRDALANLSHPALAWVDGNHYVAVLGVNGDTATIHDPNRTRKEDIPLADLLGRSGGVLLTLAP